VISCRANPTSSAGRLNSCNRLHKGPLPFGVPAPLLSPPSPCTSPVPCPPVHVPKAPWSPFPAHFSCASRSPGRSPFLAVFSRALRSPLLRRVRTLSFSKPQRSVASPAPCMGASEVFEFCSDVLGAFSFMNNARVRPSKPCGSVGLAVSTFRTSARTRRFCHGAVFG
jgi:hypothetical protein